MAQVVVWNGAVSSYDGSGFREWRLVDSCEKARIGMVMPLPGHEREVKLNPFLPVQVSAALTRHDLPWQFETQ